MKTNSLSYVQNILAPCLVFSVITGAFTGILIFLFKIAASWVIAQSEIVYKAVHTSPVLIPGLVVGMALRGVIASVILNYAPEARGGGIPTAITILRGIIPFHWIKSILSVFVSAMWTYFCGVRHRRSVLRRRYGDQKRLQNRPPGDFGSACPAHRQGGFRTVWNCIIIKKGGFVSLLLILKKFL